ncbi:MAG: subclass B3 metallo-beta-lactamase [Phenylobacterium zucineum]|nr:MAG: subclass B3 metallo-beta-lactamase [Phenylobacterium zucineum]
MKPYGLILALAATLPAWAAGSPASWSAPTPPFKIADNLYYVGTEGISVFLITTPKGHILIDGAMPGSDKTIEASIKALGFKLGDVKILLNTHAHFDHAAGLAGLKRDTGARMIAGAADRKALETGTYLGFEEVKALDFEPLKVDQVIGDGEKVSLGGMILTAHLTPGHTAGCTTWTFPVKADGKIHQALLYCSTSVALNRLVNKTRGPQYPGIVADYQASFAKLKAMKADIFLAPHNEQFDLDAKRARLKAGGTNPFIDPTALSRVVAASEADFKRDLAKQQDSAK